MKRIIVCTLVLLAVLGFCASSWATITDGGTDWIISSNTMTIRVVKASGYMKSVNGSTISSAISPLILKTGSYGSITLPTPTVTKTTSKVTSTYNISGQNLSLVLDYIPTGDYIAVNASITNSSASADYWLKMILCLPLYNTAAQGYYTGMYTFPSWGGGHFETADPWDPSGTGGTGQDWINSMFPVSCTLDTTNSFGMAIGLTPDYRVSFRQALFDLGPSDFSIKYAVKIVIPKNSSPVAHTNFLLYGFKPNYAEQDCIAEYYKIFPTKYQPTAGINQKCVQRGSSFGVRDQEQVELTGYPNVSYEERRRGRGSMTWWYAPWKKAGFFYGNPNVPADVTQWNAALASFAGQAAIPSYFTQTLANYNAAQGPKFVDASHWDFQNMYYMLTWCEKAMADSSYPNYRVTDDNNAWKLIPGWTVGWAEDYDMFMDGTLLTDTTNRLASAVSAWRLDGFAFDVCDDMLKAKTYGLATNNITNRNERSWTISGSGYAYIMNAIGNAQLMDNIHNMTNSSGVKMAAWPNAWYGFAEYTGWSGDCMLIEDSFMRVLQNMDQFQRDRRMLGTKPRLFHEFTVPDEGAFVSNPNWNSMSVAQCQQFYRDIWNQGVLSMFYAGIFPTEDQVSGYQIGANAAPVLGTVIPAGWQPVSALTLSTDTGATTDLWRARYGTDINAYVWVGNQNSSDSSPTVTLNNMYLEPGTPSGNYTYVLTNYDNTSLYQEYVSTSTTNQTKMYPAITHYKYGLAKTIAKINAKLNGFSGATDIIGDKSSGIVDGYINSPSTGSYTMSVSIPADSHCTDVSYNIGGGTTVHPTFNNTTAGLVTWTIPFTAGSFTVFDISWASNVQLSSDSALMTFPYVNANYTPNCQIVTPNSPDEWDTASATRIQEYFKYYFSKVYSQTVTIPIVTLANATATKQVRVGVDASATPIITLANGNNYVEVKGTNSTSRFDTVTRFLSLLDGQYTYIGTIVDQPSDTSSNAYNTRNKAGLLTGGVLSGL